MSRRLPAQAYQVLALLALRGARGPLSKGELAWQIRANHPMATRVLQALVQARHVDVAPQDDGSYRITITAGGSEALRALEPGLRALFWPAVERHFRYGKWPPWLGRP